MSKLYSALDICDYIIRKYDKQNRLINPLRLYCLIFFCKAYFIVSQNRCLFSEKMYAVDFGAIVPEVYDAFKCYGGSSIIVIDGRYLTKSVFYNSAFSYKNTIPAQIQRKDTEILDEIIRITDNYSFTKLHDSILSSLVWRKRNRCFACNEPEMFSPLKEITDNDFREMLTEYIRKRDVISEE